MRIGISGLDIKFGARMLGRYRGLSLVDAFAIAVTIACGAAAEAFMPSSTAAFHSRTAIALLLRSRSGTRRANEAQPRALYDFDARRRELNGVEKIGAYRLLARNVAAADRPTEPVGIAQIGASAFRIARMPPMTGGAFLQAGLIVL